MAKKSRRAKRPSFGALPLGIPLLPALAAAAGAAWFLFRKKTPAVAQAQGTASANAPADEASSGSSGGSGGGSWSAGGSGGGSFSPVKLSIPGSSLVTSPDIAPPPQPPVTFIRKENPLPAEVVAPPPTVFQFKEPAVTRDLVTSLPNTTPSEMVSFKNANPEITTQRTPAMVEQQKLDVWAAQTIKPQTPQISLLSKPPQPTAVFSPMLQPDAQKPAAFIPIVSQPQLPVKPAFIPSPDVKPAPIQWAAVPPQPVKLPTITVAPAEFKAPAIIALKPSFATIAPPPAQPAAATFFKPAAPEPVKMTMATAAPIKTPSFFK